MLNGHGDDLFRYDNVHINFSSNIYNHFNHQGLLQHLAEHLENVRNYPEPVPSSLETALSDHLSLHKKEVMVTSGCTEAIYLVAQTFRNAHSTIISPTFSEYADACCMYGHTVDEIFIGLQSRRNTHDEFPSELSSNSLLHSSVSFIPRLLWICNPNNPTGTVIPKEELSRIIETHPQYIFVIDASYAPYTTQPLLSPQEAVKYDNVIMLHSMTKEYGVPGLRIGYVTANASLLKEIKANRLPWSVSSIAIDAGKYLIHHLDDYRIDAAALCAERERVATALTLTGKIEVYPSDTHILLCQLNPICILRLVAEPTASALKEYLAINHGILIRDAGNFCGLDNSYFRIAIQSPEENDVLISIISKL